MPSRQGGRKKHQTSPKTFMANEVYNLQQVGDDDNANMIELEAEVHTVPSTMEDTHTKGDNPAVTRKNESQYIIDAINKTLDEKLTSFQDLTQKMIENSNTMNDRLVEVLADSMNGINQKFDVLTDILKMLSKDRVTPTRADNSRQDFERNTSRERYITEQGETTREKSRRPRKNLSYSDSDDDTESAQDSDTNDGSIRTDELHKKPCFKTSKLPIFTGKENWKAWITRFEDIAKRNGWTAGQKLDQILPCLQGQAGEFVFCQLTGRARNSYKILVQELHNRYREIETTKTYAAKFARRNQMPGESVREFAAELKRLYGKAHNDRRPESRQEDLLRRFFDGALNPKASFDVEYHKEPRDIDEAVYFMIMYEETRKKTTNDDYEERRPRKTRRTGILNEEYDSATESEHESVKEGGNKQKVKTRQVSQERNKKNNKMVKFTEENEKQHEKKKNEEEHMNKSTNSETNNTALVTQVNQLTEVVKAMAQQTQTKYCQLCLKKGHEARECYNGMHYVKSTTVNGNRELVPSRNPANRRPPRPTNVTSQSVNTSNGGRDASNFQMKSHSQDQNAGKQWGIPPMRGLVPNNTSMPDWSSGPQTSTWCYPQGSTAPKLGHAEDFQANPSLN